MRVMRSHTIFRFVAAALVMGLPQLPSADAKFDGFDGRPRPDGMLDAPTRMLGPKPESTYQGEPAYTCTWYAWESFYYGPKDTKYCSHALWDAVKKLPPSNLLAFQYYTFDTFPQSAYCTVGCFDLSAISPPDIATPPPPWPPVAPWTPSPPVDPPPSPRVKAPPSPPPPVNDQPRASVDAPPPAPVDSLPPVYGRPPVDAQSPPLVGAPSTPVPPIAGPDLNTTSSFPLASAPGPLSATGPPSSNSRTGLIAGITSASFGAVLLGLLLFCCCFKHGKEVGAASEEEDAHLCISGLETDVDSRPFTFKELSAITKNFADSELLSSGAFGDVFRGMQLSAGGTRRLVAVKRIRHHKEHGPASFLAEANSLRQIRHRNLLQLRGWCDAKEGMFLVYDFMSNGSLDTWLHIDPGSDPSATLPWPMRRSVLAGVAEGLGYLHEGCVQCVLHRDIKSSNVMLDESFTAHLGDFGLARLVDHNKMLRTTVVAGTLGYMAPEMFHTGRATKETDVYAFGILVLEVVSGRSPINTAIQSVEAPEDHALVDRVWGAHEAGRLANMVDPRLLALSRESSDQLTATITNVLQLGLVCCLPNPRDRPSIRLVSHWFQSLDAGTIDFPQLPAFQPAPPARYVSVPPLSSTEGTSSSHDSVDTSLSSVQTSTTPCLVSHNQ